MSKIRGDWNNKIVDSSLQEERDKKDWVGGAMKLVRQAHMGLHDEHQDLMEQHEELKASHKFYDMTRREQKEEMFRKVNAAYRINKKKLFVDHEPHWVHWSYTQLGNSPIFLHYSMFLNCCQAMMTDEQKAYWMPKVRNMEILGTYAQTEIGHGSDISGLRTTATFDQNTQEFIINTPDERATKWWPGDLAHATHTVVFAVLVLDENPVGVMPFIVQLRDLKTAMPLPGIKVGDMGPKFGYNSKSNGWCSFDNVRIPRNQMLMRFVSVDEEGSFSIEGDTRILYAVMMNIRMQLIDHAGIALAKALTIGIRYSAVRRQFKNNDSDSKVETKLLDYQTQQAKLTPLLGTALAFTCAHTMIEELYMQLLIDIENDKFENLDMVHHFTSGMKSVFTDYTQAGMYTIRQSIGGAGYSAWSGLPYIIDEYAPCTTFEGDNTVMAQQGSRYLIKQIELVQKGGQTEGLFSYINSIGQSGSLKSEATTIQDYCSLQFINKTFKAITLYIIKEATKALEETKAPKKDVTNKILSLDLVRMTQIHIKYITFVNFINYVNKYTDAKEAKFKQLLQNVACIVGVQWIQEYAQYGFESGFFNKGEMKLVNGAFKQLLLILRPQLVPLVESYNMRDCTLMSAIGNSYGDIYTTHLEWARTSRLNDEENGSIPDGFMEYIMPILQGKL